MRKYYQAALAVTAAVSLISLLIYRHEYNKLRYVLEVFNYFGKPYQRDAEANCTNSTFQFSKFDMKFEEPYASWQRLENDIYLYSAYSIREKEVEVIAFAAPGSILGIECVLFFENEVKPVVGSFQSVPIDMNKNVPYAENNLDYSGYHFLCKHKRDQVPVGISFLTKSIRDLNDTPVLSVKNQLQSLNYSGIGLCVIPPIIKKMHPLDMISFINFHDLLGMNNFIVYDFGIPTQFNSYLREMSMIQSPYWKFTYAVIPWNFPFPGINRNVIRSIIQTDCLYRTYNKAMYVATLSWEEYLVLKYHHSIVDLIGDYKKSKLKADSYKLKVLTFCTQQVDDTHGSNSSLIIFRKTHYDPSIADADPICIYDPNQTLKKTNNYIREIGKDLAVLNRYKHCIEKPSLETDIHDSSILRFAEDIQNSELLRKVMTEKMFLLDRQ